MNTKPDAFELLRQANPVPASRLGEVAERARVIRPGPRLFHAEEPAARRTVSKARAVLAAAALGVGFLLVAPALGLDVPALDFWRAEKAPPKVVEDFESLGLGAPEGMDPGAIPGETRKVTTVVLSDGPHTLWVSPTRHGGFCLTWTNASGGCDKLGTVPLSVSWSARGLLRVGRHGTPDVTPTSFTRLDGHVDADYADSVEIRFADGSVVHPEIVWVSEPIGAGFFIYDIPQARRQPGREMSAVVALDGDGRVVAEDRGRPQEVTGQPPVEAILDEKRAVVTIPTRNGESIVWDAPTRYEGRCAWLEFRGRSLPVEPCMPKGYPGAPFGMRFVPTHEDVLLVGAVAEKVASVELRFEDGDRAVVTPQHGFVLYEIPREHLAPGREAAQLVGRDILGNELHRVRVDDLGARRFPCLAPHPLSGRQSGPFCLEGTDRASTG